MQVQQLHQEIQLPLSQLIADYSFLSLSTVISFLLKSTVILFFKGKSTVIFASSSFEFDH